MAVVEDLQSLASYADKTKWEKGPAAAAELKDIRRQLAELRSQAKERFAQACERRSALGCGKLADALEAEAEQGSPVDPTKRRDLLTRACQDGGLPTYCFELAAMLRKGEGGAADPIKARAVFTTACEEGGLDRDCPNFGDRNPYLQRFAPSRGPAVDREH